MYSNNCLIFFHSRLAYSELYVTLGMFFHRFPVGLKVYKTTPWDMEYDDFFSSYHIEGRNWFKATGSIDSERAERDFG
jgi:hypothetical protein